VVAERCILESYRKQHGETRNAFGAFSTVSLVTTAGCLRTQLNCCYADRYRGT
jgi:hypothetical protein